MAKRMKRLSSLLLIMSVLSFLCVPGLFAADAPGGASGSPPAGAQGGMPSGGGPGGMPGGAGGMPGGSAGGPPGGGMPGAPSKAAIYIDNGAEDTGKEYTAGQYKANIKKEANGVTIQGLDLTSGDFTFNGIVATGAKSVVTLDKSRIKLGVTKTAGAKDSGGAGVTITGGATMHIKNSQLQVDGAQRYGVSTDGESKLIVNDSTVTQTGSNEFTSSIAAAFSNEKLLISGVARANMSTGASKTYYFNSVCTTEGWASLSTDSAQGNGLDLYAYNTKGIAQHGGYGTYADTNCRVWLYGSDLESAEIGVIISKNGQVHVFDGARIPSEVIKYNLGKTTTAGTVVKGGRNAVMIHAPDMMGEGKRAADCGTFEVVNSTLATTSSLKSTMDYAATYGKAIGAYVDYITGPAILVKSTSADITLDNTKIDSFTDVLAMSVLNSDSMGNFLKEEDGKDVKPVAISMKNMDVTGDIKHMDYQRIMTLSLENTKLKGAVITGTMEEWNKLWSAYTKKECNWLPNDSWKTYYGVKMTVKKGATWDVSGVSTLSSLTVEEGGTVKGKVQVDGKDVTLSAGKTYAGKIVVKPL